MSGGNDREYLAAIILLKRDRKQGPDIAPGCPPGGGHNQPDLAGAAPLAALEHLYSLVPKGMVIVIEPRRQKLVFRLRALGHADILRHAGRVVGQPRDALVNPRADLVVEADDEMMRHQFPI